MGYYTEKHGVTRYGLPVFQQNGAEQYLWYQVGEGFIIGPDMNDVGGGVKTNCVPMCPHEVHSTLWQYRAPNGTYVSGKTLDVDCAPDCCERVEVTGVDDCKWNGEYQLDAENPSVYKNEDGLFLHIMSGSGKWELGDDMSDDGEYEATQEAFCPDTSTYVAQTKEYIQEANFNIQCACCEYITFSSTTAGDQNSRMGTYELIPDVSFGYRPAYKHVGQDHFLFYYQSVSGNSWVIGSTLGEARFAWRNKGVQSVQPKHAACPTDVTEWNTNQEDGWWNDTAIDVFCTTAPPTVAVGPDGLPIPTPPPTPYPTLVPGQNDTTPCTNNPLGGPCDRGCCNKKVPWTNCTLAWTDAVSQRCFESGSEPPQPPATSCDEDGWGRKCQGAICCELMPPELNCTFHYIARVCHDASDPPPPAEIPVMDACDVLPTGLECRTPECCGQQHPDLECMFTKNPATCHNINDPPPTAPGCNITDAGRPCAKNYCCWINNQRPYMNCTFDRVNKVCYESFDVPEVFPTNPPTPGPYVRSCCTSMFITGTGNPEVDGQYGLKDMAIDVLMWVNEFGQHLYYTPFGRWEISTGEPGELPAARSIQHDGTCPDEDELSGTWDVLTNVPVAQPDLNIQCAAENPGCKNVCELSEGLESVEAEIAEIKGMDIQAQILSLQTQIKQMECDLEGGIWSDLDSTCGAAPAFPCSEDPKYPTNECDRKCCRDRELEDSLGCLWKNQQCVLAECPMYKYHSSCTRIKECKFVQGACYSLDDLPCSHFEFYSNCPDRCVWNGSLCSEIGGGSGRRRTDVERTEAITEEIVQEIAEDSPQGWFNNFFGQAK